MERHITKMIVLGEGFQVGDLYDYRTDRIVTGQQCWESEETSRAILSDDQFKLKLKCFESDSTLCNKWENMGVDEHSQASVAAGIIEKYRSAAKYLNDQAVTSESSHVLLCRVKSRKVRLDLQVLLSQDVPHVREIGKETKTSKSTTNPTHVVVGVSYGAEAYCVLTLKTDEDPREDAKEYLSEIAGKMDEALANNQDSSDFKNEFGKDEKAQLNRIKCRLYADLQTSAFRECSVFDAYKHCLKLIQQVQKTGVGSQKPIPITVLLCPLKVIMEQTEGEQFEYHDIDQELVARCGRVLDELDRIRAKSAAARTVNKKADKASLSQFEEAVVKYKGLMQKSLKNGTVKARETGQQDEIEKVAQMAENHSIFKPSRLERWLLYKQEECEMYDEISNTTDIVCLANTKQLEIELQNSFDAKYTLVLSVPLLDEQMNGTLEAMKKYLASKLDSIDDPIVDEDGIIEAQTDDGAVVRNVIQRKKKHVLAKIRELADHVEKNKHLENQVQFFIVFDQPSVEFACRYSVYEKGRILTRNLSQLPGSPTGLRIQSPRCRNVKKTSIYPIDVEWDYADNGLPCHFIVEYRLDGSKDEPWTQRRTSKPGETQITIPYKTGSPMTIRVAADTCIGRSEFSQVLDTVTILELNEDDEGTPEKVLSVTEAETGARQEKGEPMDHIGTDGLAASSTSTSQQSLKPKNSRYVVADSTSESGRKTPIATGTTNRKENAKHQDKKNDIDDHTTDDEDEDMAVLVGKNGRRENVDRDEDKKSQEEEESRNDAIEQHVTKTVALESGFQVGGLYDYFNDRLLTGGPKYWEPSKIKSATQVEKKFILEFERSASDSLSNRMENMGLDVHFQASIVAGLIEKPRGVIKYLSDQSGPSQATQVLICRAKTAEVRLDLQTLVGQNVRNETKTSKLKTNPTHLVASVTYGGEAYCVLTQDLKGAEANDDAREEAEEYLSEIASKMEEALEERQELAGFKKGFNDKEKKLLSCTKCRLYTDFQTSAVLECSVYNAYQNCLKFIQQVEKTDFGNKQAIPISIQLCPVKAITEESKGDQFEYQDVDHDLVTRCCCILDELDRICAKTLTIRTVNPKTGKASLRQFKEVVDQYKDLMQTSLKNGTVKARETGQQDEIEKVLKIVENHPMFKPTRLEQWLSYKQAECEIYDKISKITKIVCLASQELLQKELEEVAEVKYTMVLNLPSLDEEANKTLKAMKDYAGSYTKLVALDDSDDETDVNERERKDTNIPWHQNQRKQNSVLSKAREFAEHVKKNKHLEDHVRFLITFNEKTNVTAGCHYSVYESGILLKDNISQMPGPPTGLRFHASKLRNAKKTKSLSTIAVEWDYADVGFPCHFLVEYQLDGGNDECWTQKKTTKPGETKIEIPYKSGSAMAIRVAADTCIGRSEFSEIINVDVDWEPSEDEEISSEVMTHSKVKTVATSKSITKKNLKTALDAPTCVEIETVTQKTAELGWQTTNTGNKGISYRVRYWRHGEDASEANVLEVASGESGCRLEDLQPETTYSVNIVAVSNDGQEVSAPSEEVTLRTLNHQVRFAEIIAHRCQKISDRNGMDLLAVPIAKSRDSNSTVQRFVFGKQNSRTAKAQHRTILVMGATGAGKTTLINGMINYIFNVEWEDNFRFQLIREQLVGHSQSVSQTSSITAYDIYHAEGFRIPYSLTIVDTPGYGDSKGLDRDKEITEMVHKFFKDKEGIQQVDVIGFVAQASLPRLTPTQVYIFDSVFSIFGNDVKDNIDFLLTFADGQVPPVLTAITEVGLPYPKDPETGHPRHHKFNNSGFFCSNRESGNDASNNVGKFNKFFWRMGMENFRLFFVTLATMKTKSLSLTQQVLEERKRLEATIDGLQPLIRIGLAKMEEMRKIKQMITNSQAQIEANENVEIEVEVNKPLKVEYRDGYLTNCNKCYVTCHLPCAYANDDEKVNCSAMDYSMPPEIRTCTVCPKKCIWNMHANQPYKWEYVAEKQITSSDAIKEKYEKEMKKKLSAQELVKVLERDVIANDQVVLEHVNTVTQSIQKLDEIALRPNPFSTPEYIDLIIDSEKQEQRQGFKERIESWKKLRKMAVITSRIKNKESLMTHDRQGDIVEEDDREYHDAHDDDGDQVQTAPTNPSVFQKFSNFFRK